MIDVACGQNFSVVIAEELNMTTKQENEIFEENIHDLLDVGIAISKREKVQVKKIVTEK